MIEKISIEELPFKEPFLNQMKKEGLTIEVLKGEFADYYYLTNSSIHRVYRYRQDEKVILLTEILMFDLYKALENESFKNKVLNHLGN